LCVPRLVGAADHARQKSEIRDEEAVPAFQLALLGTIDRRATANQMLGRTKQPTNLVALLVRSFSKTDRASENSEREKILRGFLDVRHFSSRSKG